MNVRAFAALTRRRSKTLVFACAILVAMLTLANDSRPVAADHTDIFFTQSTTGDPSLVTPVTSLSMVVNDPGPVTLYVWARNVHDPQGVAGFEVKVNYVSWLIAVNSLFADTTWLGSTGRSASCTAPVIRPNPTTGAGRANVSCNTLGAPPPFGPQGSGLLATITVKAGVVPSITNLVLAEGTLLVNTGAIVRGSIVPPAEIPTIKRSLQLVIARCGDVDGDGGVTISDIFLVAGEFGKDSVHPEWNPIYDLNIDGGITIQDIFLTAGQFGTFCTA